RDWLPGAFCSVKPWMSEEDAGAGARWSRELVNQLDRSGFGILCVTKDNQQSPWLLFEAGALVKAAGIDRIVPYLFGLSPTDVKYPLALFQGVEANESGTLQLLKSINEAGNLQLPEELITTIRDTWWPKLEPKLSSLHDLPRPAEQGR